MLRFVKLQEDHLEMVMGWRMKPEVTAMMLTDITPDMEKQRQWFKRVSADPRYWYWIIEYQGRPIGVFNLADLDWSHKRCNAGYYIGEHDFIQLGAIVPPYLYNYIFETLKLNKIYGEVVAYNENVLKMHRMHGYREVGVMKEHIFRHGKFQDIVIVELLAKDWLAQTKYRRFQAEFET